MDVHLIDETDLLSVENLLDTELTVTKTNDDGEQETEKKKLSEYATKQLLQKPMPKTPNRKRLPLAKTRKKLASTPSNSKPSPRASNNASISTRSSLRSRRLFRLRSFLFWFCS